jgi:hypothetical protein
VVRATSACDYNFENEVLRYVGQKLSNLLYQFMPFSNKFNTNITPSLITEMEWQCRGGSRISSRGGGGLKKIALSGGRREICWGISCEKSRFCEKKNHIFDLCRSLVLSRQISVLCESISVNYCSISVHFDSISVRYHSISVHYRGRSRVARREARNLLGYFV